MTLKGTPTRMSAADLDSALVDAGACWAQVVNPTTITVNVKEGSGSSWVSYRPLEINLHPDAHYIEARQEFSHLVKNQIAKGDKRLDDNGQLRCWIGGQGVTHTDSGDSRDYPAAPKCDRGYGPSWDAEKDEWFCKPLCPEGQEYVWDEERRTGKCLPE